MYLDIKLMDGITSGLWYSEINGVLVNVHAQYFERAETGAGDLVVGTGSPVGYPTFLARSFVL
jgi:hypothetical protein